MLGSKKKRKQEEEEEEGEEADDDYSHDTSRSENGNRGASSTSDVLARAREHLQALTGAQCESIIGIARLDQGWKVRGVVVEVERIPPTTDILASYDLEMDENGEMNRCQRVSRYWRSQALTESGTNENGYG